MAQKKATKTGAPKKKSGSAKRPSDAERRVKKTSKEDRVPLRYILTIVFITLAILTLCACFPGQSPVMLFIHRLLRFALGRVGLWLSPVMFGFLFWVLAFHWRSHPLRRGISVGVTVLCISAFVHLVGAKEELSFASGCMGKLWNGTFEGADGGLLGGLLATVIGKLGVGLGVVLLGLAALIAGLLVFNITPRGILLAFRDRPRPEREKPEEPDDNAKLLVDHMAYKHIQRVERRTQRKKKLSDYDMFPQEEPKKTSSKSRVRNPAELLEEQLIQEKQERKAPRDKNAPANAVPVLLSVEDAAQEQTAAAAPQETPVQIPIFDPDKPLPADKVIPTPSVSPAPPEPAQNMADGCNHTAEDQPEPERVTREGAMEAAGEIAREVAAQVSVQKPEYMFPPLSLLKTGSMGVDGTEELRENTRRLNEALQSFKIEAKICNVTRGPSVTRYEVELAQGVRLAKLTALQSDLALALGAVSVRTAAIPDRIAMVGIEVPNKQVSKVTLRDVISSSKFICAKSRTTFAVGKDIGGECILGNIAQLPHMLIAGTTGSGKSVCMNSIIVSLLYKATPEDVKLIMIDPKMVELGIYNGIPHLLIPVVTDPKKAAGSLQWAVSEMMRRYKLMSDAKVRDLKSMNQLVESTGEGEKLPQIVVIIDELADLMLVAAKEVEDSIVRIAQMGRASGIHLVIATQRPSADVITGLMKSNIPSRIAFAVASAMESRIILDNPGAEKLVGKGDMLYSPVGGGKPHRVQGCFVSDEEVEAVASYVKERSSVDYSQEVLEEIERTAAQEGKGGKAPEPRQEFEDEGLQGDEMLPAAVEVFLETGLASVSMLQRRLKLGYARAARIVDEMEEKGIVGPFAGSKPRAILVTKEQWQAMQSGAALQAPAQMSFEDAVTQADGYDPDTQ